MGGGGPVVSSHNEWDPLEEIIVGVVGGATVPPWDAALGATMPEEHWDFFRSQGARPFPAELVRLAAAELDGLVRILEAEGVRVRRPEALEFARPFATPDWSSPSGVYAAMPRDTLLVVGEEIIEAPMAWRSRYFEANAYRPLIKEYFRAGARWTAAPKPMLDEAHWNADYAPAGDDEPPSYVISEHEPTFDAADFARLGRDLVAQLSNVTNRFGVDWLQSHLGSGYRIHVVEVRDSHPMHIDATLMPLAPGRLLVNPERLPKIPPLFRGWEVLEAPRPCFPDDMPLYLSSKWISMNVLSLDEKRVVVEAGEAGMIAAMKRWGFEPIPCPFRNFNAFGGSFHCATADVRRRGELRSYF